MLETTRVSELLKILAIIYIYLIFILIKNYFIHCNSSKCLFIRIYKVTLKGSGGQSTCTYSNDEKHWNVANKNNDKPSHVWRSEGLATRTGKKIEVGWCPFLIWYIWIKAQYSDKIAGYIELTKIIAIEIVGTLNRSSNWLFSHFEPSLVRIRN